MNEEAERDELLTRRAEGRGDISSGADRAAEDNVQELLPTSGQTDERPLLPPPSASDDRSLLAAGGQMIAALIATCIPLTNSPKHLSLLNTLYRCLVKLEMWS